MVVAFYHGSVLGHTESEEENDKVQDKYSV